MSEAATELIFFGSMAAGTAVSGKFVGLAAAVSFLFSCLLLLALVQSTLSHVNWGVGAGMH